jgi:23S rRNA (guanosine2251-2'-O)-methyltransferase
LKPFRHQHRPKKNKLIVGRQQVRDAIISGIALDRIYMQNNLHSPEAEEIKIMAFQKQVPINRVPAEKLNSFNAPGHEGYIAQISIVQYESLEDIIPAIFENGETPLFLLLDGITDIRNIGAIARTAWCCGVHAIIIPEKGVGALNEDAMLTSAGALEKIAICRVNSLMKAVDELHLHGITVFASEMSAEKKIYECDFLPPAAIIMGSEDKGIFPALMKISDQRFHIPMKNEFESLNVSVATGIVLYEAMRQRGFQNTATH